MKLTNTPRHRSDERGIASIVVVFVLIIILSLISLGFTRLMDRAVRQASANNLGAAADAAVLSGINQVAAYIQGHLGDSTPVSSTTCRQLLDIPYPTGLGGLENLSGTNGNVKFTCVLINSSSVNNLLYTQNPPYKSQVVMLKPSATISNMMVSWDSSDPSLNNMPPAGLKLYDEKVWGTSKYEPMMRLTLYPINGSTIGTPKTIWMYPSSSGGNNPTLIPISTTADGSLMNVKCGVGMSAQSGYNYNTFKKCNAILNLNGVGATYYYARLTPIYAAADMQIQANNPSQQLINFSGTQYIVDVTAKANNTVRRMQARVDGSVSGNNIGPNEDAFPEYGLRNAMTICKRLEHNSNTLFVNAGATSQALCNNYTPPLPVITNYLKVTKVGPANGTIVSTDTYINCGTNTPHICDHTYPLSPIATVTLNAAISGSNSRFGGWEGDCAGQSGLTCTIPVNGSTLVQARFNYKN